MIMSGQDQNRKQTASAVPEIQGKAKSGKAHAKPVIPGTSGPHMKVYHKLKGDGSAGDTNG